MQQGLVNTLATRNAQLTSARNDGMALLVSYCTAPIHYSLMGNVPDRRGFDPSSFVSSSFSFSPFSAFCFSF